MFKEEIQITNDDRVIINKLLELLCSSQIDDCFYTHDQEFFTQLEVFPDGFTEAYQKGFGLYFSDKWYYRWVRSNVISKFIGLLESLFKGLLEQFNEDEDGILTYKNCRCFRSYHIVTQSEQQAETTEVSSRILTQEEAHAYEKNGMLETEDTVVQVMPCYCIRVESADKVDSKKKKKELIREIRVLVFKKMCDLLEPQLKRANCVEEIQYRLILATLIGTIDKSFTPRFKNEANYNSYEVARGVTVTLESEFKYFSGVFAELRHYKKSLIKL